MAARLIVIAPTCLAYRWILQQQKDSYFISKGDGSLVHLSLNQ